MRALWLHKSEELIMQQKWGNYTPPHIIGVSHLGWWLAGPYLRDNSRRKRLSQGRAPPCCTPCRNPELLSIPSAEHIQCHRHRFPGMAGDTDTGQGSWSPEDHRKLIPSRPAHKYCATEHPERLMLLLHQLTKTILIQP